MGLKENSHKLLVQMDTIFIERLTGGITSLVHVIRVEGTVFHVLILTIPSI